MNTSDLTTTFVSLSVRGPEGPERERVSACVRESISQKSLMEKANDMI